MTDEDNIRFGFSLNKDKPFADAVFDRFDEMGNMLHRERQAYKAEIAKLRTENQNYKQAYFDQWYNNTEIEKCWNIIVDTIASTWSCMRQSVNTSEIKSGNTEEEIYTIKFTLL